MAETNLEKLTINRLSEEQYQTAKEAGEINENELYCTPDESEAIQVIDNLESTSTTDALSANQGRVLNENKVEIETITNENGTAIKFSDGTMICRGRFKLTDISYSLSEYTYYSPQQTITFPEVFIENPSTSVSVRSNNISWVTNVYSTTTGATFNIAKNSATVTDHSVEWIAIGRWK